MTVSARRERELGPDRIYRGSGRGAGEAEKLTAQKLKATPST
jgi:hypothetical protein